MAVTSSNNKNITSLPTKSVDNYWSGGGIARTGTWATGKEVLSGALTADTYKELLATTGAGILTMCAADSLDATSRTVGLKVVVDGVTVFDAVSAAGTEQAGIAACGTDGAVEAGGPIIYTKSLSVSAKSSISETDKVALRYTRTTV